MTLRLIFTALLSAALIVPATAAPVRLSQPAGIEGHNDVVMAAAKRKKKKQRQVYRNPRNGDVLIGRVSPSRNRQASRAYRGNGGAMFGAMPSGRRGGYGRTTGPYEVPDGGYGQNCGIQVWTPNPTSPTC